MSRNILVMADIRHGLLRRVTSEMTAAACAFAEGGVVSIALIGNALGEVLEQAQALTPHRLLVVEAEALTDYTPGAYRKAVMACVQEANPDVLLFAHSAIGRDVAPMVAAQLGAGQVSDVIGIEQTGGYLQFTRPIYAGKAFTKVRFQAGAVVATVRPNNLPVSNQSSVTSTAVARLSVSFDSQDLSTVVKEIMTKTNRGVDLSEAKIIVSGGRGVKSADGFKPLYALADVLGAAVGASRGACDAGYCDYALQIGQTGKVVTPELYVACGISGAIQHLAGMSNSKVIVAVNKDPDAPIFRVADYGIVGDLFEVVPLLTEELRTSLA